MAPIRRRQVMDAVIQILERDGWDALTMKSVSARAGVSTGVVAHYFGSKDAMVAAAIRDAYRQFTDDVLQAVEGENRPLGKLVALVDRVVARSVPDWSFWLALWGKMPFDPVIREELNLVYRQYVMLVEGILNAGAADGSIAKGIRADRCAGLFVALIDGLGMRSELGPHEMPPALQRSLLLEFWAEILGLPDLADAAAAEEGRAG